MSKVHNTFYINSKERFAQIKLNKIFHELIANIEKPFEKLAIVCIGTDRSTGDSFGPLVGYFLSQYKRLYSFDLYMPVHNPLLRKRYISIEGKTYPLWCDFSYIQMNYRLR